VTEFGPDVTAEFCAREGLQLIVRSHELVACGVKFMHSGRLATVFSARNYTGVEQNDSALLLFAFDEGGHLRCRAKRLNHRVARGSSAGVAPRGGDAASYGFGNLGGGGGGGGSPGAGHGSLSTARSVEARLASLAMQPPPLPGLPPPPSASASASSAMLPPPPKASRLSPAPPTSPSKSGTARSPLQDRSRDASPYGALTGSARPSSPGRTAKNDKAV
jgi:hypothetical protein